MGGRYGLNLVPDCVKKTHLSLTYRLPTYSYTHSSLLPTYTYTHSSMTRTPARSKPNGYHPFSSPQRDAREVGRKREGKELALRKFLEERNLSNIQNIQVALTRSTLLHASCVIYHTSCIVFHTASYCIILRASCFIYHTA